MATAAPAEVAEEAALLRRVMFWRFQRDFSLGGLCRGLGSLIVCCIVYLYYKLHVLHVLHVVVTRQLRKGRYKM